MHKQLEETLSFKDHSLHLWWVLPQAEPIGTCLMIHGFGEHGGRYLEYANYLADAGYAVFLPDLIGHGLSSGARGYIADYKLFLDSVEAFVRFIRTKFPDQPQFIYGHSLGGTIVADTLIERKLAVAGAVLSSPFLLPGSGTQQHPALVSVGRWFKNIIPWFTISVPEIQQYISSDTSEIEAFRNDSLIHAKMSTRLYFSMLDKGKWVVEHANEINVPTLLMQGTGDQLSDPVGAERFAERADPHWLTYKTWDGCAHDLLHEAPKIKQEVFAYCLSWLNTKRV